MPSGVYIRKPIGSKCKYCGERFAKSWQVAQHVKIQHPRVAQMRRGKSIRKSNLADNGTAETLSFCPKCGCKLAAIRVALTL